MFRQAAARCLRQAMSTSGRTLQQHSAAIITPVLQRSFVRSAVPAMGEVAKAAPGEAHLHLADLLDREVNEELENIEEGDDKTAEMEVIAERIHKKFNVKETPGSTVVKLHAKHGNEKIVISFDVQDTTEDEIKPEDMEEENFEDYSVGIRALATISKGHDKKLCFSLVCTNGIWIEKVAFDDQNRDIQEDPSMYWVDFADYPEDVQEAFTAYLADRDITEDLGLFVSFCAYKKEREHYVSLLKEAKAFVNN